MTAVLTSGEMAGKFVSQMAHPIESLPLECETMLLRTQRYAMMMLNLISQRLYCLNFR